MVLLVSMVILAGSTLASTIAYLGLEAPTGAFAVGRSSALLVDPSRPEPRGTGESRAVRVIAWYPAVSGTGTSAEYVPDLDAIRGGLEASGEIHPLALAGLPFVRGHARASAEPASADHPFPVVLLTPGNATNVAFYGSLAEELASHGYVVLGLDHPYQVAAVEVEGGRVAVYQGDQDATGPDRGVAAKIDERLADISFVLDRLSDGQVAGRLADRVDLERIAIVGHSNGGLAAAQACLREPRVVACVNIDGQSMGGPFSARSEFSEFDKPFLFLTKESDIHPRIAEVFEASGQAVRVVVPAASHGQFTDGPRFEPRLAPVDGTADGVLSVERDFVRSFLDHAVMGVPGRPFDGLSAPTDVFIEVYPLGGRQHLNQD